MSNIRPPAVQSAGQRRGHTSRRRGSAPPAVALKVDNCPQNANCARDMDAIVADMQNGSGSDELVFFVNGKKVRKRSSGIGPVGIGHLSNDAPHQCYLFKCQGCLSKSDFDCLNRNTIKPGPTYWLPKFEATTRVWSLTCAAWIVNVYVIDVMRHKYVETHGFICG